MGNLGSEFLGRGDYIMTDRRFVPLSYYLNPNLFDFIELPEGSLDKIGIIESRVVVEENLIPDTEESFEVNFFDEQVTVSWTEAKVERKTIITFTIANSEECSFGIPGLDGIELVMASTEGEGASPFTATLTINDDGSFFIYSRNRF